MTPEVIQKDLADGRSVRSFFRPRWMRLLCRLLWDGRGRSRWPHHLELWIVTHWPTGTEMWDY